MERVIFRIEKNEYDAGGIGYLAVFPDDPANPGRVACLPFHFDGGTARFEPFCEMDLGYYYDKTKIVHRKDSVTQKLLIAVQQYCGYGTEFHIVEKMMRRK